MKTIENPAYTAVLGQKPVVVSLAHVEGDSVRELAQTAMMCRRPDWLVRQGMDVMLIADLVVPIDAEERTFNTWIIRQNNRVIGRVSVPLHTLRANARYTLSRALCIPERIAAPE
jgi:hypothetical protein